MRKTFWLFFLLLSACTVPLASPTPRVDIQPTSGVSSLSWASLQLSGRLLLIGPRNDGFNLVFLNLASGDTTLVYHAPANALLVSALVSPDGKQILLTYAPPPSGPNQTVYTSLYLMPIDGAGEPRPIFSIPPSE